jgi:hypothetical protein
MTTRTCELCGREQDASLPRCASCSREHAASLVGMLYADTKQLPDEWKQHPDEAYPDLRTPRPEPDSLEMAIETEARARARRETTYQMCDILNAIKKSFDCDFPKDDHALKQILVPHCARLHVIREMLEDSVRAAFGVSRDYYVTKIDPKGPYARLVQLRTETNAKMLRHVVAQGGVASLDKDLSRT